MEILNDLSVSPMIFRDPWELGWLRVYLSNPIKWKYFLVNGKYEPSRLKVIQFVNNEVTFSPKVVIARFL